MSNNLILLAAIGGAVVLVLQKQAQAAGVAAQPMPVQGLFYTPAQQQSANVNGDMWARLLGDGWRNLVSTQNSDGSPAFLKNDFGQVTTSDGKPVGGSDPMSAYVQSMTGLPTSGGPDYIKAVSPFADYLNGSSDMLGWW